MGIDKNEIVSTLRELGIRPGDCMGLHSSVPSLGRIIIDIQKSSGREGVELAVHDVIDGFLESLGDEGLLMAPTFSYCFSGSKDGGVYHPQKSPSRVGMLTDLFFRRPDAKRSLQPTHSVAAIGAGAAEIIRDHEKRTALGVDSPFHRLAQAGGWICFLGTNSSTLSLLHVAEVVAEVPYANTFCYGHLGWKLEALTERDDGTVAHVPIRENPGCSDSFGKFDELLAQAGITRSGKIYQADVTLFKAQEALALAVEKLRREPLWLLCPARACLECDFRRQSLGTGHMPV